MKAKTALAATISCVRRMIGDESGGTLIEYAIIMFLVSVAIGFLFPEISAAIDELFTRTASDINSAVSEAEAR